MPRTVVLSCLLLIGSSTASADTADRLLQLVAVPGVAGYESAVREAIEMLLPAGARVRADSFGNILIRAGGAHRGPDEDLLMLLEIRSIRQGA
jgi:hypothetical protein